LELDASVFDNESFGSELYTNGGLVLHSESVVNELKKHAGFTYTCVTDYDEFEYVLG
jgi:hypothetical protein